MVADTTEMDLAKSKFHNSVIFQHCLFKGEAILAGPTSTTSEVKQRPLGAIRYNLYIT